MNLNRNTFFEAFAQSTPTLNLIFLNHLGAPSKLLTDISTIDLLADKKSKQAFINYCTSHPLVKELLLIPHYRKTNVVVELQDGSELNFYLLSNLVVKTLKCLDVNAIRKNAYINEFGMFVPSREHHFEYMIVKSQFGKDPLSERYRNYFAGFEFSVRAVIFKHIQSRFNLVFNTLEDLYEAKPNTLLSIVIGLRAERGNTLLNMFVRSIELSLFNLFGWITKKGKRIPASPVQTPLLPTSQKKRTAGQAVL